MFSIWIHSAGYAQRRVTLSRPILACERGPGFTSERSEVLLVERPVRALDFCYVSLYFLSPALGYNGRAGTVFGRDKYGSRDFVYFCLSVRGSVCQNSPM